MRAARTNTQVMRFTSNMFRFKGVVWDASRGKFMPQLKNPETGKRRTYGRFDTAEGAARQYDELAREFFGAAAILNFPGEGETGVFIGVRPPLCQHGHSFAETAYITPDGERHCRACNLAAVKQYQTRK